MCGPVLWCVCVLVFVFVLKSSVSFAKKEEIGVFLNTEEVHRNRLNNRNIFDPKIRENQE